MGESIRKRNCHACGIDLGEFGGELLLGEQFFDEFSGMRNNTGMLLCKKCFRERTGESLNDVKEEI